VTTGIPIQVKNYVFTGVLHGVFSWWTLSIVVICPQWLVSHKRPVFGAFQELLYTKKKEKIIDIDFRK